LHEEIKIDKIIRSQRRSIALVVCPDATLVVRAPMKISLEYIQDLVFRKRFWIDKKRKQVLKNGPPTKAKEFIDGESFFYLGEVYKLKIVAIKKIERGEHLYFPAKYLSRARVKIVEWYKQRAKEEIAKRAIIISRVTGWDFKSISITSAKTRWGSCGARGSINFTWKLVMAPLYIIDYVVVHELAHTVERNHSVEFWNKVEAVLPDYKIRQKWLQYNRANFKI